MANYLASIFGTEQDKVNCSFVSCSPQPHSHTLRRQLTGNTVLQNRRLQTRRSLLAKTRQTLLLTNNPPPEPLPKSRLRPEDPDESQPAAEPFRCVL